MYKQFTFVLSGKRNSLAATPEWSNYESGIFVTYFPHLVLDGLCRGEKRSPKEAV